MSRARSLATPLMLLALACATSSATDPVRRPTLSDTTGTAHRIGARSDAKAVVLVFLGPECPLCQRYAPTLKTLDAERGAGVEFFGVVSGASHARKGATEYATDFGLSFPLLFDAAGELAALCKPTHVPEAFVLTPELTVQYRGRIDDWYEKPGKPRMRVDHHDLRDAIAAVRSGKAPTVARTTPVGCLFEDRIPDSDKAPVAKPTFHKDVLPILQKHCQDCHRPGEVGPFSLTEFKDASKRAGMVRRVVEGRTMPPWKPTDGVPILHDRRMSEKEIATLAAWADAGAPEGDPKDAPPAKVFPKGWALGEPDLVLELPADVHLGANGDDHYRAVPLPTGLTDGKYVVAYEVRPGNARVLHHAVAYYDKSGTAQKLAKEAAAAKQDGADRGPGYESPMGIGFTPKKASDVGVIGGWAPGIRGVGAFPGTGMMLPKGSDVVLQLHYHRTGKAETDRTRVGLYFAKKDATVRPLSILTVPGLVSPSDDYRKFDAIPAGKPAFRVEGKIVVETDCEVFTCTPHMHLLGRKIKVTMTPPGKPTQTVLAIDDWDFDWQEVYRLKTPIAVPAGTMFAVEGEYDNTAANAKNPLSPPRDAKKGEGTTDEMLFAFFRATPKVPGAEIKVKYLTDRKDYELALKDVVYGRRDGLAMTMDVFRPTGRPNGAAMISVVNQVFATAPEMIRPEMYADARARGYTVFAVLPGGAPRHTIPEMRDDVRRAVRFLRHNARSFGIDPERIAASGASSGGLLALHLGAAAPGDPKAADPVDRLDGQVRALAVLFPPTDLLNYGGKGKGSTFDALPAVLRGAFDFREFDPKTGRFDRLHDLPAAKDKVRALYADVSPITHVAAKFAPTFLMHGDKDFLVPFQQSEVMLAELKKAGVPAKLTTKPGGGHSWPKLVDDMPQLNDWLDEHLKK